MKMRWLRMGVGESFDSLVGHDVGREMVNYLDYLL